MIASFIAKNVYHFSKIYKSPQHAIEGLKDNAFIMVGGFGICGVPMNLINAIK